MRLRTHHFNREEINQRNKSLYAHAHRKWPSIYAIYGYSGILAAIESDRIWDYNGKNNGLDVDFLKLHS